MQDPTKSVTFTAHTKTADNASAIGYEQQEASSGYKHTSPLRLKQGKPSPRSRLHPYVKSSKETSLQSNPAIGNTSASQQALATSYLTHQTDGSFQMSPEERRQVKYQMNSDRVVGFYKKVLTDLRSTI